MVEVFQVLLVAVALVAALAAVRDRAPPLAPTGWVVAVLYLEWMVVAMSYGKVDHDRFAFLVLLFVLPSVGSAPLRSRTELSEAAGWALSMVTLRAVVRDVCARRRREDPLRGLDGLTGPTLDPRGGAPVDAAVRKPLLDVPWVLHAAQYGIMVMELAVAPVLLVRWQRPAARLAARGRLPVRLPPADLRR